MRKHLMEIFEYRDMVNSLVKRDLRGKYKGSVLGFLWTYINPLCQIIVYTVVFSVIIRSGLEQFYVYMITGMIPWLFFDMSLRQGTGCVRYQGEMVKKIYFTREVLPLACVTSNFINMLFCFMFVFFVVAVSGIGVASIGNGHCVFACTGFCLAILNLKLHYLKMLMQLLLFMLGISGDILSKYLKSKYILMQELGLSWMKHLYQFPQSMLLEECIL